MKILRPLQGCSKQGSQVIAQVVDTCNTCDSTTLNLPYKTFQKYLGSPSGGNLGILYQQASFTCRLDSREQTLRLACLKPLIKLVIAVPAASTGC